MRFFGRTSVYLFVSSLQNLTVPRVFYFVSVSLWNDLAHPVCDGVGLAGIKSTAYMLFYRPKLLDPFLSSTVFFHFYSLFLRVGIVGMRSSDRKVVNRSLPALHCHDFIIIILLLPTPCSKRCWLQ